MISPIEIVPNQIFSDSTDNSVFFIETLLTSNLFAFDIPDVLNVIDYDCFNTIADMELDEQQLLLLSVDENNKLKQVAQYIEDIFFRGLKYRSIKSDIWISSDEGVLKWHNDSGEGINFTAIVYLTDHDASTGGDLMMKDEHGINVEIFYPKRGTVAFINQKRGLFHKTTRSNNKRVAIGLDYIINLIQ